MPPPPLDELWLDPARVGRIVSHVEAPAQGHRYRHWDTLRHLEPPEGLTVEEWWAGIKLGRSTATRTLPLRDAGGAHLTYSMPDAAQEMVHFIDRWASGRIATEKVVTNDAERDRYLVSSLIEEAVRSSQLEGAATTRRAAKEMIRTGRAPRDRSERMVFNNYLAMEYVRERSGEALTPEMVVVLHRIVTEDTLDDPADSGRLQRPDERRVAIWWNDTLLYEPPPAEQLPGRLELLCKFANGGGVDGFIHPVVRAVLVHFWLSYDHPFVDGNGRTARALFYWTMLREGYWLTEFLSISSILRKAPVRYTKSFLYVETDEGDTTYFILSQLRVIQRAIEALHEYLRRKVSEVREIERLIRSANGLNHRQIALLGHALRDPDATYTFRSHQRSHRVAYQSARTDLLDLKSRGLVTQVLRGRTYTFHPVPDLGRRLRGLSP